MKAIYFKITNDLFFYNKKTLMFFCAFPFIIFLIILFSKGHEINYFDISSAICHLASGVLVISLVIKMNDFKFQKFSIDKDVYALSSKKYKEQCYNESIDRILQNEITIDNLHINEDNEILKFLTNFNLSFIEELKKGITFERFDEYLITNESNDTSGYLFFTLYKKSLLKIIKDFIIDTDYLKNASDNTKQQFIHELTNRNNLSFDSKKGLHYDDKFVFEFLENDKAKKSIEIQEQKVRILKDVKQIKLNNISKFEFYKILEGISVDVLKVKLTKSDKEELKSLVGIFYTSEKECKFDFDPKITTLSFLTTDNSTDFILSIQYLLKSKIIENNLSGNMQILDKIIPKDAHTSNAKNRAEIFRLNSHLIDFSIEKQKNIDAILQNEKINSK